MSSNVDPRCGQICLPIGLNIGNCKAHLQPGDRAENSCLPNNQRNWAHRAAGSRKRHYFLDRWQFSTVSGVGRMAKRMVLAVSINGNRWVTELKTSNFLLTKLSPFRRHKPLKGPPATHSRGEYGRKSRPDLLRAPIPILVGRLHRKAR